jgi:hypothetical protein
MICPIDILVGGGYAAWASAFLGIIILFLILAGIILAITVGQKKPFNVTMVTWAIITLALGFICMVLGVSGTVTGLCNTFAYVAEVPSDETAGLIVQGVYESYYNLIVGFFFAFVSLFGWALVRTIAGRR